MNPSNNSTSFNLISASSLQHKLQCSFRRIFRQALVPVFFLALLFVLTACSANGGDGSAETVRDAGAKLTAWSLPEGKGSRDNTPVCLVPEMSGAQVFANELASIDYSNSSDGYVFVTYTGTNEKVKLQITGPNEVKYTYSLKTDGSSDDFPLSAGDGKYLINVFENIKDTQYSLACSTEIDVTLKDVYLPFLYPNQYVKFNEDCKAVDKAAELAAPADSDLDVVSNIFNYIIRHVTYDQEEAETVQSGYLPDVDEVLETGKGICLDYSALMVAMLRSQQIPTRMEVGYAGDAYHAWLSVYIDGVGWVNGLIEFDGVDWSLMDPTFTASNGSEYLKSFIGEGDNYTLKYIY